jgi:alpha-1,2-mannosyltransferase
MPEHHETTAPLWRQLAGGSYLWWALAVIIVIGTVTVRATAEENADADTAAPAAKVVKA